MITMWTVYDKPSDFPDQFVARKFIIGSTVSATSEHVTGDTLDEVRAKIPGGAGPDGPLR